MSFTSFDDGYILLISRLRNEYMEMKKACVVVCFIT